jgi:hypothetical protein
MLCSEHSDHNVYGGTKRIPEQMTLRLVILRIPLKILITIQDYVIYV